MLYRVQTASGVFEVRSLDLAFEVARAFRWMCLLWKESGGRPTVPGLDATGNRQ